MPCKQRLNSWEKEADKDSEEETTRKNSKRPMRFEHDNLGNWVLPLRDAEQRTAREKC